MGKYLGKKICRLLTIESDNCFTKMLTIVTIYKCTLNYKQQPFTNILGITNNKNYTIKTPKQIIVSIFGIPTILKSRVPSTHDNFKVTTNISNDSANT